MTENSKYNPLNFGLANREMTEDEKKEIELKQRREDEDLKKILDTPSGRRFVWRILTRICDFYLSSYSREHSWMSFLEGKKEVARQIMSDINRLKPVFIEQMASEEMSEKLKNKEKKS